MKKLSLALAAAALVMLSVGCSMVRSPASYSLYADVKDGLAVGTGDVGTKPPGVATATTIFGITTGDCSIATAAKQGSITKIGHVDYHSWGILGIYGTTTTQVYGQ